MRVCAEPRTLFSAQVVASSKAVLLIKAWAVSQRLEHSTAALNMEQTELTKPETLEDLIRTLHKIFESDSVNVEEVQGIMESYESKPHEWMKYAKFDQYR